MKDVITSLLVQYGDVTLFFSMMLGIIGLPVPDEFILFFAGTMSLHDFHRLPGLIGFAWLGSICGMSVNYALGRTIGLERISRITKWIGLTEPKLTKGAQRFHKFGGGLIVVGFFVAGLRHASPFIAGASGMAYKRFACFAYVGALLWITVFITLGYRLGNHWHRVAHLLHHPYWIAAAAIVIVSVIVVKKLLGKTPANPTVTAVK